MNDFLFRGRLASLDPDMAALIELEALRQVRKLIMIPSESTIPEAVREAVGSVLGNLYAEGYPPDDWRNLPLSELLDVELRLAEFRRKASPRYYKGTEIVEIIESLTRQRTAQRFANERVAAHNLFVNVQPLSGAPANSAVYTAFAQPGDTIMGLNLLEGGHLTHGSPVNRSGLFFKVIPYGVRPDDERLDYEQMHRLALQHRPKFIIAGFTSYPWAPDWERIRAIADEAGSLVLADVSHVAGLIIAGQYPSPVGIADIVSFTTHKTLHGPRGAVLLTHRADLAKKLDRAVFPGEQGGPHVNNIAGLAVAMKLAGTEQFHALQKQIVINARVMAERFAQNGIRVAYGGTDTHMLLIDVGKIKGADGTPLSGDIAARILDIAGVTANRNTIPGDASPFRATGVRFGTTWVTQRGLREAEMCELTDAISEILLACRPYSYPKAGGKQGDWRSKVEFGAFVQGQQRIGRLAARASIDYEVPTLERYPKEADAAEEHFRVLPVDDDYNPQWRTLHIYGPSARRFLDHALAGDVNSLGYGEAATTCLFSPEGDLLSRGVVECLTEQVYLLHVEQNADLIAHWLTALSDGYVRFDADDLHGKLPGPVSVSPARSFLGVGKLPTEILAEHWPAKGIGIKADKPYFIGYKTAIYGGQGTPLPTFTWTEAESPLLHTPLFEAHRQLGAKFAPFAGYEMPLWYNSVSAEHRAVRESAGLFDVTHMGVLEVAGTGAEDFLNLVATNDASTLAVGEAHYSYLLDPNGQPLDDIFVYRQAADRFMVVVNASNNAKVWAWWNALLAEQVALDLTRPWARAGMAGRVTLRDLRAETSGAARRVDLALQGPQSTKILLALGGDPAHLNAVKGLAWANFCAVTLGGFDLLVSRTGYTGERAAYEIFVHPEQAAALFLKLVELGATPCGLAARDSLRTEAGLPLYGHELAGALALGPSDAGFTAYVKTWKPFFIGKAAFMAYEAEREAEVVRWQMDAKGLRAPIVGDPLIDMRGRVVGQVTSCAADAEGRQIGLAWVKRKYTEEGTGLLVYAHLNGGLPAVEGVKLGDKLPAPQSVTVLSRFPKKKKS
jgi:glycine hydroxymethyltransferase